MWGTGDNAYKIQVNPLKENINVKNIQQHWCPDLGLITSEL